MSSSFKSQPVTWSPDYKTFADAVVHEMDGVRREFTRRLAASLYYVDPNAPRYPYCPQSAAVCLGDEDAEDADWIDRCVFDLHSNRCSQPKPTCDWSWMWCHDPL